MKVSEILLEAAERANRGRFGACQCILSTQDGGYENKDDFNRIEALHLFEELLRPDPETTFWWGYPHRTPFPEAVHLRCTKEEHNARILGVLFAAQVAKDDEKQSRKS
jgi:hypothetical protein